MILYHFNFGTFTQIKQYMSLEDYNFLKFSKDYITKKDTDPIQHKLCEDFIKNTPIVYPLVVEHSDYFKAVESLEIEHYGGKTKLISVHHVRSSHSK